MILRKYFIARREIALKLLRYGWSSTSVYYFLRYGTIKEKVKRNTNFLDFVLLRSRYEGAYRESLREYHEKNPEEKLLSEEQRESLREDQLWNIDLSEKTRSKAYKEGKRIRYTCPVCK